MSVFKARREGVPAFELEAALARMEGQGLWFHKPAVIRKNAAQDLEFLLQLGRSIEARLGLA